MLTLLLVSLALLGAGWGLLARLRPRRTKVGGALSTQQLSVIIPARNEEQNLPTLLRSLRAQPVQPREIIVVDDGSTDRTADVAGQHGATVIASKPLPAGWRGKTWACHQGAQVATGELLLFVDADTWFEPDGLARVLAAYFLFSSEDTPSPQPSPTMAEREAAVARPQGALSVGPFHVVRRAYENLSLFFNLNMVAGTVPDGLFGQMLLVDRQSYWRVGGHQAVRDRVLENFFLAEQFRAVGVRVRSLVGRGVVSIRMYPGGLGQLIEGWTKGFAAGAARTPRAVLLLLVAWMVGLTLVPLGWLASGGGAVWAGLYLLCAVQVGWLSRRVGSFHLGSALLYPVPLLFFFAVFIRSALRSGRTVTWKGREIRAD